MAKRVIPLSRYWASFRNKVIHKFLHCFNCCTRVLRISDWPDWLQIIVYKISLIFFNQFACAIHTIDKTSWSTASIVRLSQITSRLTRLRLSRLPCNRFFQVHVNVLTKHFFVRPYEVLHAYKRNLRKTLWRVLSSSKQKFTYMWIGLNRINKTHIFLANQILWLKRKFSGNMLSHKK